MERCVIKWIGRGEWWSGVGCVCLCLCEIRVKLGRYVAYDKIITLYTAYGLGVVFKEIERRENTTTYL